MKIGDIVYFAAGLDRHLEPGKLTEVYRGSDDGRVYCVIRGKAGERHIRELNRVKTLAVAKKRLAAVPKRRRGQK